MVVPKEREFESQSQLKSKHLKDELCHTCFEASKASYVALDPRFQVEV